MSRKTIINHKYQQLEKKNGTVFLRWPPGDRSFEQCRCAQKTGVGSANKVFSPSVQLFLYFVIDTTVSNRIQVLRNVWSLAECIAVGCYFIWQQLKQQTFVFLVFQVVLFVCFLFSTQVILCKFRTHGSSSCTYLVNMHARLSNLCTIVSTLWKYLSTVNFSSVYLIS